ncbi:MAG: hypothetical protein JWR07_2849 [Nevskia sp.]|nr:hypothetical protein [Nevskia sp.]
MNAATPTGYIQKPRAEPQRLAAMLGGMLVVTAAALYVWFIGGRSLSADVDAIRRFVGRARIAALAAFSGAATDTSSHSTSALSAALCGHRKVSR